MPLSPQQFTDRFGVAELLALTDPDNRTTIKTEVFAAAVQDAFAEISSRLNGIITLDPEALPDVIIALLADLTRHRLYADTAPETVLARTAEARAFLDRLVSGTARLEYDNPVDVRISTDGGFSQKIWTTS